MEREFNGNRRTFMKRLAILGGVALLWGGDTRAGSAPKESPLPPESRDQGYRLTEHIKKYYETART
jgi:hypothetical protein